MGIKLQKFNFLEIVLIVLIVIGFVQLLIPENKKCDGIKLSEGCLSYLKFGEGNKTLILIHGSPGPAEKDFLKLGPEIKNYTVYALDMYGFGSSEMKVKNYGIEHSAEVINEFLSSQNLSHVSVLGYSWGSGVAINFAYLFPEKTEKLILISGMGLQEAEPTGNYYLEHFRYIISYPFVIFYPGVFAGGEGWRKGFMRSFMDSDQRTIRKKLSNISVSALVLHGKNDTVILPKFAEEHAFLLKNSKLYFFDGDHGQVFENPIEISEQINLFLNEDDK